MIASSITTKDFPYLFIAARMMNASGILDGGCVEDAGASIPSRKTLTSGVKLRLVQRDQGEVRSFVGCQQRFPGGSLERIKVRTWGVVIIWVAGCALVVPVYYHRRCFCTPLCPSTMVCCQKQWLNNMMKKTQLRILLIGCTKNITNINLSPSAPSYH